MTITPITPGTPAAPGAPYSYPDPTPPSPSPGRRTTMLGPVEIYLLDQWGRQLHEAFGHYPYLVGSAMKGLPWRDIDVRLILPDKRFTKITGAKPGETHLEAPLLQALNVAFTVWGQRVTSLPIDFQFQSMTDANEDPANSGPRNPLGVRARSRQR